MDDEKLKQKNQKKLEKCTNYVEKEYSVLIDRIKAVDYVGLAIEGARQRFEDEQKKADEFYDLVTENEEIILTIKTESEKRYKALREDENFDIPKNIFTFPKGTHEKIYDLQIKALKYADPCYQIHEKLSATVDMFGESNDNYRQKSEKMFDAVVCISGTLNTEKIKTVLSKIVDKKHTESYIKSLSTLRQEFSTDYETAQKIKLALQEAGIKATIKNKVYADVIKEHRLDEIEKYQEQCKKIKEKISERYQEKNKPDLSDYHKPVWSAFGITAFISWIACLAINWTHLGDPVAIAMSVVLAVFLLTIPLLGGYGIYFLNKRSYYNSLFLSNQVKIICDNYGEKVWQTVVLQYDNYRIYEGVDKFVAETYNKRKRALQKAEEVYGILAEAYETEKKELEKTINFMPPSTNYAALPRIIELMEKGAATDYKTAVWQVEQEMRAKNVSDEIMEIIEAAEEAKRAELQAQRYIQEYYERQRLETAKEQAESQKRAEEAAIRTEELAKKQADDAAAAANAAKRSEENTKEILRRVKKNS